MDYREPDTSSADAKFIVASLLLPVVAKLDRYGDLGRDKSFPFTQRARLRLLRPISIALRGIPTIY